jgi:hypothetical protein
MLIFLPSTIATTCLTGNSGIVAIVSSEWEPNNIMTKDHKL